jgi:hypothetical protein
MRTVHEQNIYEAKQSIKSHIKFFESLLKHLNSDADRQKNRALWASWCLHRYINEGLIVDIEQAMKSHTAANDEKQ